MRSEPAIKKGGRRPPDASMPLGAPHLGAPDRTNLEPAEVQNIFEELEEWERFLKQEPEIIHKLKSLDEAATQANEEPTPKLVPRPRPRGPSL